MTLFNSRPFIDIEASTSKRKRNLLLRIALEAFAVGLFFCCARFRRLARGYSSDGMVFGRIAYGTNTSFCELDCQYSPVGAALRATER